CIGGAPGASSLPASGAGVSPPPLAGGVPPSIDGAGGPTIGSPPPPKFCRARTPFVFAGGWLGVCRTGSGIVVAGSVSPAGEDSSGTKVAALVPVLPPPEPPPAPPTLESSPATLPPVAAPRVASDRTTLALPDVVAGLPVGLAAGGKAGPSGPPVP